MNTENVSRTELLLGKEAVERLRGSFVVVVGAGAVGGYALEALVRAGIGKIRVIDDHVVDESNLNRQILATRNTVGRPKTEVAEERARSINPEIDFEGISELVCARNISSLMDGNPDAIIDAIDTVGNKVFLLRYVAEHGIKTFSSMGAALRTDPEKIKVGPLRKTRMCPVASAMRSGLKDLDTSVIDCVYSEESVHVKPTQRDNHMKSRLGSMPTIPAIFGMILANEAILYLISDKRFPSED